MLQNKLVQSVIQPPCQRCTQGLVNSDPLSTGDTIYVKVDKVGTNYNFDEPMLFCRDNIAKKINENDGGGDYGRTSDSGNVLVTAADNDSKQMKPGSTTAAVIAVVAKDAAGVVVPSQALTVTSSDTTIVASTTATSSSAAEAAAGTASVSVTGISAKYGKVTLTFTDATTLISATASVTLSSATPTTVKMAFDKSEYAAGEKMTLTVTATDVNGLAVAPIAPISTLTSNTSLQGFPAAVTTTTIGQEDIQAILRIITEKSVGL